MVKLTEIFIRKGTAARPGNAMAPKFITIHNTANTGKGAGARSHASYMTVNGGQNKSVSYHYVVDDSEIIRLIPDTEIAWHAGDGARGVGNLQSLAIEICENPESNLRKATDNAAELTARLMSDWKIPLANVVQHNRWSGKNCPRRIRKGEPYSWEQFKKVVQMFYDEGTKPQGGNDTIAPDGELFTVQTGAFKSKQNAEKYAADLNAKGVPTVISKKKV